MNLANRRFPPARSVEELEACFVVLDASGQRLGFFYFGDEARPAIGGHATPRDRGAGIAASIAKLAGGYSDTGSLGKYYNLEDISIPGRGAQQHPPRRQQQVALASYDERLIAGGRALEISLYGFGNQRAEINHSVAGIYKSMGLIQSAA